MSWDNFWNGIEEKLEQFGGAIYDVVHSDVVQAATDATKKSVGIFTGGSEQELQAISAGAAEATTKSISKIEKTSKYFFWGTVGVIGLIIYSKLK